MIDWSSRQQAIKSSKETTPSLSTSSIFNNDPIIVMSLAIKEIYWPCYERLLESGKDLNESELEKLFSSGTVLNSFSPRVSGSYSLYILMSSMVFAPSPRPYPPSPDSTSDFGGGPQISVVVAVHRISGFLFNFCICLCISIAPNIILSQSLYLDWSLALR